MEIFDNISISGNTISSTNTNGNIGLSPNGTGEVVVGNGSDTGKVSTSGAYDLILDTNAGTNSGSITITDGTNGNDALKFEFQVETNQLAADLLAG